MIVFLTARVILEVKCDEFDETYCFLAPTAIAIAFAVEAADFLFPFVPDCQDAFLAKSPVANVPSHTVLVVHKIWQNMLLLRLVEVITLQANLPVQIVISCSVGILLYVAHWDIAKFQTFGLLNPQTSVTTHHASDGVLEPAVNQSLPPSHEFVEPMYFFKVGL